MQVLSCHFFGTQYKIDFISNFCSQIFFMLRSLHCPPFASNREKRLPECLNKIYTIVWFKSSLFIRIKFLVQSWLLEREHYLLHLFDKLIANIFRVKEKAAKTSVFRVASIKFTALLSGMPDIFLRFSTTSSIYSTLALRPVPMAVAPRFISCKVSSEGQFCTSYLL